MTNLAQKLKRKAGVALGFTLGLILMFNYMNCSVVSFNGNDRFSSKNTIAGNPFTVSDKILSSVCSIVMRCHPEVTKDQCSAGLLATSGFNAPLGLSTTYSTLGSIKTAETSGLLVPSSSADSCIQSLTNIQCSDPIAQASYDSLFANPYAGSVDLLSGTMCKTALAPVTQYSCDTRVFLLGANNTPNAPMVAGMGVTYSVSPSLPAGLSLDSATGAISGTPTVTTAMTSYVVTASGAAGVTSQTIQIQTADGYLVNDFSDDPNSGGSICKTTAGNCSLRAAIQAAESSGTSKVIVVPAGTIALSSGTPLSITSGMSIFGDCHRGTIVDGLQKTEVFDIEAGPTLLNGLTVQNGATKDQMGAGIGVFATTAGFTTTLKNITVKNNKNTGGASGMSMGAGIGVGGQAGAIAVVNLSDCTVSDNVNDGCNGGGVGLFYNTKINVARCSFINNSTPTSYGGGLSSHSGDVTVSESLFSGNSAPVGEGGGLFIDQFAPSNSFMTNVTFDSNSGAAGGGVFVGAQTMTITNATFANNSSSGSAYGGALAGQAKGIILRNSLFSNNLSSGVLDHCSGSLPVTSQGYNLSDAASSDCNLLGAGDKVNQSPLLAPLQDNGGSTSTMALLPGSPAINGGNPATCPSIDQRGLSRLTDGKCDIGAFEVQ